MPEPKLFPRLIPRTLIDSRIGTQVKPKTRLRRNNARWRRYRRDEAKRIEYEENWSLDAQDRREKTTKVAFAAKQNNQERIDAGQSPHMRKPPRHIRRRPLQEAFRKAQSK